MQGAECKLTCTEGSPILEGLAHPMAVRGLHDFRTFLTVLWRANLGRVICQPKVSRGIGLQLPSDMPIKSLVDKTLAHCQVLQLFTVQSPDAYPKQLAGGPCHNLKNCACAISRPRRLSTITIWLPVKTTACGMSDT